MHNLAPAICNDAIRGYLLRGGGGERLFTSRCPAPGELRRARPRENRLISARCFFFPRRDDSSFSVSVETRTMNDDVVENIGSSIKYVVLYILIDDICLF